MACLTYILAHNHHSTNFAQVFPHNANLFRGNVVDVDEKAFVELGYGLLACSPDFFLSCLRIALNWH